MAASLRALRRSRHVSQRQLADLAGVTASAISQAERAERGLSLSTLVHLSAALGLTVDDLLHGEDPPTYRIGRRVGDPRRGPERGGATSASARPSCSGSSPRRADGALQRAPPARCADGQGLGSRARVGVSGSVGVR